MGPGPQFVLTHETPDDVTDPTITFLSGDIKEAVATALAAAEGKNVVVIGATIARQCIDEGLIDEIVVHLAPVLLGEASGSSEVLAKDGSIWKGPAWDSQGN